MSLQASTTFEPNRYRDEMRRRGDHDIADSKRPNYLIVYPDVFPIRPADIEVEHLMETFGHAETEISAYWLLKLAKERGSWRPFTREDIEKIYHVKYQEDFHFNRLVETGSGYSIRTGRYDVGGGWIYYDEEMKRYYFTVDFVLRCCWAMKNHPQGFAETFESLWYDRFKPEEAGCITFDFKSSSDPFRESKNMELLMRMQQKQLQRTLCDATSSTRVFRDLLHEFLYWYANGVRKFPVFQAGYERLVKAIEDFRDAHWAKIVAVNAETRTERSFTFTHPEVTFSSYCMAGRIMVTFGSTDPGGDQITIVGSDDILESRPGLQSIDWTFDDAIRCVDLATKHFNVDGYVPDKGVTLDVLAGQ